MKKENSCIPNIVTACLLVVNIGAVAAKESPAPPPRTPVRAIGYLPADELPSSVALIPPPPAAESAAMARDEEINRKALALQGSPRWDMAAHDAVLGFPAAAKTFACALNIPIDEERTPRLIALMRKTLVDAGRATSEAKRHYRRTRPFATNDKPTCTPTGEDNLRRDGSYPSGHSSAGWAFGLVLGEVAPERIDAILRRARAFGDSRTVCNVHWQSDVEAGRMVAAGVVARLHAEPAFREDIAAARAEVEALRAQGLTADRDCDAEANIVASWN